MDELGEEADIEPDDWGAIGEMPLTPLSEELGWIW